MFLILKSKRGQGLIEYLVIVAIMGVATIGIVSAMNQTVKAKFTSITYALQGKENEAKAVQFSPLHRGLYSKKDLGNFFDGSDAKKSDGGDE